MRRRFVVAAVAVLAVVAAARFTIARNERARTLPRDRGAAVVYVALGDSTVEGVAATSPSRNYVSRLYNRLRAEYPAAQLENLGVAGAVSADVLDGQLARAIEAHPDLVTLSVGPNDITGQVPVERYERNVDAVLGRLARDTGAVVVVNLLPDLAITPRFRDSDRREAVGDATRRFNTALENTARAHGADVVDLYAASRAEVPVRPELVASDGYHPSDLGYARWAELMWAHVAHHVPHR